MSPKHPALCWSRLLFHTCICTWCTNGSIVSLAKLPVRSSCSIQTQNGNINAILIWKDRTYLEKQTGAAAACMCTQTAAVCRDKWSIYSPVQSGGSRQTCEDRLDETPCLSRAEVEAATSGYKLTLWDMLFRSCSALGVNLAQQDTAFQFPFTSANSSALLENTFSSKSKSQLIEIWTFFKNLSIESCSLHVALAFVTLKTSFTHWFNLSSVVSEQFSKAVAFSSKKVCLIIDADVGCFLFFCFVTVST